MQGVRLKGPKDYGQTMREVVLLEVLAPARCHDVVHQFIDLPNFVVHEMPPLLMQLHLL